MTDVQPGDRVRAGRVVGTVRRVLEGVAEIQDNGQLLGRPTTWRIKVEALTKVGTGKAAAYGVSGMSVGGRP
jgi:hypothetical protein